MAKIPEELFRWNISEIAHICAVSEKTASRWKAGTSCPPLTAIWVLSGDLGRFHKIWAGWHVHPRDGELVSPEGWCISMYDVRATPLQRSQIAVYQAENRRLKEDLEAKEYAQDQPLPSQWGWDLSDVKVQK